MSVYAQPPSLVVCPICKRELPVPAKINRSEILWKHINSEHCQPIRYLPAIEEDPGEKKIDIVMRQLHQGVADIQNSTVFRQFLITMSKFHDYSISNQILIAMQMPTATRVAGFNTWKDLGRWVKKGEKGIAILAPIVPVRPTCEMCGTRIPKGAKFCPNCGAEVDEDPEYIPRSFKVVHVFDVSQTDGKELPDIKVPVLTGEANEELFGLVLSHAQKKGVTVNFDPDKGMDPDTKGYFQRPNFIWVKPDEPRAQQLKTLLHEFAHYYTENVMNMPRADAETIAESVAYVVGAHYGFDSGVRSFPYVAVWAKEEKVLKDNLAKIRHVSSAILTGLEGTAIEKTPVPTKTEPYTTIARVWPRTTIPWTSSNMEGRFSLDEVKQMAREKGLPTTGTKKQLLSRILNI